jgi:hypothetical protein
VSAAASNGPVKPNKRRSILKQLTRLLVTLGALVAGLSAIAIVSANGAGGVTGPAFYVDGELYRTVGTPTDLSGTGAPDHSFDTIYDIAGQPNVAEAAPGMPGFNGGRWMVRPVAFNTDHPTTVSAHDSNGSGDLDSNEEVESALGDGGPAGATLGSVVRYFECPVIKVPRGRNH